MITLYLIVATSCFILGVLLLEVFPNEDFSRTLLILISIFWLPILLFIIALFCFLIVMVLCGISFIIFGILLNLITSLFSK